MESKNRKIDELGRVVLPIEIRNALGVKENDSLHIYVDTDRIILEKGRKIDSLGRIVIPQNVRKMLEINEKDELNIELIDDKIILKKNNV